MTVQVQIRESVRSKERWERQKGLWCVNGRISRLLNCPYAPWKTQSSCRIQLSKGYVMSFIHVSHSLIHSSTHLTNLIYSFPIPPAEVSTLFYRPYRRHKLCYHWIYAAIFDIIASIELADTTLHRAVPI